METTERELKTRLDTMNYITKVVTPGIVTVSCVDRRGKSGLGESTYMNMRGRWITCFK